MGYDHKEHSEVHTAHPMTMALRALRAGPALIKLRERTHQPTTFRSGKEERTALTEEHITIQASAWSEIGDTGMFRISIGDGMETFISAEDIFMIFSEAPKVL